MELQVTEAISNKSTQTLLLTHFESTMAQKNDTSPLDGTLSGLLTMIAREKKTVDGVLERKVYDKNSTPQQYERATIHQGRSVNPEQQVIIIEDYSKDKE